MRYGFALLAALLLSLAAATAGSAEPTIGSKQAEAQQVLAQIQSIDAQLEPAVEAWNGAHERRGETGSHALSSGVPLAAQLMKPSCRARS